MNGLHESNNVSFDNAAYQRLLTLFDEDSFEELNALLGDEGNSGVICGFGQVCGTPVYAFAQNKDVQHGAVGQIEAKKMKRMYDMAIKTGAPIIGIYDSNGAKLEEGIEALAAYGQIMQMSNSISGVVPQISIVVGPCGGASAMVARAADFLIMSQDAQLFIAPPDILAAQKKDVPHFASAEYNAKQGNAHIVAENDLQAVNAARDLLSRLPNNYIEDFPLFNFTAPENAEFDGKADKIIDEVADQDSVLYLQENYGNSVQTAFIGIEGTCVGAIAVVGTISVQDCRKAASFIQFCDAFTIPIVTFMDTDGFEQSIEAEQNDMVRYASMLAQSYVQATTSKIAIITGKAIGSVYIALAGSETATDIAMAYPNAIISALSPAAATAIMYNERLANGEDRAALEAEYVETIASAAQVAKAGYIDAVIEPNMTRKCLENTLTTLAGKRAMPLPKKRANFIL